MSAHVSTTTAPRSPGRQPITHRPTVVVLHAHPDDEAIFTGVLIRRLADQGARVVLVTATGGELGFAPPGGAGERWVAAGRLRELEESCAVLGVSRLVLLGRRDSGLPGDAANDHPEALVRGRTGQLAVEVAQVASAESAAAVVHDDPAGIYGHLDHVAAHRIGALAARLADISDYQVTVDGDRLAGGPHLVVKAAESIGRAEFGASAARIGMRLDGTAAEVEAKRLAMAAHASQIGPDTVESGDFERIYSREWLSRTRGPAVLEHLAAALAVPVSAA